MGLGWLVRLGGVALGVGGKFFGGFFGRDVGLVFLK